MADYQTLNADINEEESWINEKLAMLSSEQTPESMSAAHSLVKKHEAFHADLSEHQDRVTSVCQRGQALVEAGNREGDSVRASTAKLQAQIKVLAETASQRKQALDDSYAYFHFAREADSIQAWIADREPNVGEDVGQDLPSVQTLITKQEAFDASVRAFQPRVDQFSELKRKLVAQGNSKTAQIQARDDELQARWNRLLTTVAERKASLKESEQVFLKVI